jgi:hypothetical protein
LLVDLLPPYPAGEFEPLVFKDDDRRSGQIQRAIGEYLERRRIRLEQKIAQFLIRASCDTDAG